ncbi:hypothetical protein G6F56_012433 [Rhizopus delemar]|nr:hypothetical protein G6F56_012433 [Rhizopus delemar]
MGQALSEPITTKHSTEGEAEKLIYGASSMQGWRIKMEDAHITLLDYEQTGIAFFAVMDGHGGDRVAKYSSQHLAPNILNSKEFNKDRMMSIKKGFLKTDSDLRQDPDLKDDHSGCTAIVVLVDNDVIYVGNVGDSRAVISTGGKASALSKDHKPNDANESKRIKNAGGHIKNGRVNEN